jgi:predicted dehydrogenase
VLPLLKRGLDCYVEKPMAETQQDCLRIKQAIGDRVVMVGHIFLYHPAMDWIKSNLSSIGNIKYIDSQRLNWGIYQTKTTPLLSITTHDISIVQELLGTVKVRYTGHTKVTDTIKTDNIQLILENDSGITANLVTSWYWPEKIRKITIIGDRGHIVWDDQANRVDRYQGYLNGRRLSELELVETYVPDLSKSPLQRELEHFIECCDQRMTPKTDIENAIEVAKVLDVAGAHLDLDHPHCGRAL